MAAELPSPLRMAVRVVAVREVASNVRCFECVASNDEELVNATAGSHIDVFLPDGSSRQYSLIESTRHRYVFAVKREEDGRGGSKHIYDNILSGSVIEISVPRNHFPLDETAPHTVLIAGGIGITPLYAMVRRLEAIGATWELHYASRTASDVLFHDALKGYPQVNIYLRRSDGQRSFNLEEVVNAARERTHFYCCGPASMIGAFNAATKDLPAERIHIEHFHGRPVDTSGSFTVGLARTGETVEIPDGKSILDVLLERGMDIPHSCKEGVCGACEVDVLEGVPDHRDTVLSDGEKASIKTMMICCSRSKTPSLTIAL